MSKLFNNVPKAKLAHSAFDLSHERKLSLNFGKLYPVMLQEIVPGDKFKVSSEVLVRLAPLVSPMMHRVNVHLHHFYVPNRIIWDDFEDFITGEKETLVPYFTASQKPDLFKQGELGDYFGLPTSQLVDATSQQRISQLPFRVYNKIYNEYYRDENLQDEVPETNVNVLTRAWEKDYFTSALPWPQKGEPVEMPIIQSWSPDYKPSSDVVKTSSGGVPDDDTLDVFGGKTYTTTSKENRIENLEDVQSSQGLLDIREMRLAYNLMRYFERNARAGTRYVEQLLGRWGVISSDARLDRPEFLGGSSQPVVVSEVLSTATVRQGEQQEEHAIPQGNMAGHGISVGQSNRFNKRFEEHGYIMTIMSIVPRTAYMQGIPKTFSRETMYDFYMPEFAMVGEQEVKNKELYFDPSINDDTSDEKVFGYQSRYAEYKYQPSYVSGDFRNTLAHWHLARKFKNLPVLNEDFIKCNADTRIFAVQTQEGQEVDHFYCQIYHRVHAVRPMPFFGVPKWEGM